MKTQTTFNIINDNRANWVISMNPVHTNRFAIRPFGNRCTILIDCKTAADVEGLQQQALEQLALLPEVQTCSAPDEVRDIIRTWLVNASQKQLTKIMKEVHLTAEPSKQLAALCDWMESADLHSFRIFLLMLGVITHNEWDADHLIDKHWRELYTNDEKGGINDCIDFKEFKTFDAACAAD